MAFQNYAIKQKASGEDLKKKKAGYLPVLWHAFFCGGFLQIKKLMANTIKFLKRLLLHFEINERVEPALHLRYQRLLFCHYQTGTRCYHV